MGLSMVTLSGLESRIGKWKDNGDLLTDSSEL